MSEKGKSIFDKAGDLLTKSVGDDGLKTDIKITLSRETYWYIGLALVIAAVILLFIYFGTRSNWVMPVTVVNK